MGAKLAPKTKSGTRREWGTQSPREEEKKGLQKEQSSTKPRP